MTGNLGIPRNLHSYYGIVRCALYQVAMRIFPELKAEEAINEFDRLVIRAQALGEFRKTIYSNGAGHRSKSCTATFIDEY